MTSYDVNCSIPLNLYTGICDGVTAKSLFRSKGEVNLLCRFDISHNAF